MDGTQRARLEAGGGGVKSRERRAQCGGRAAVGGGQRRERESELGNEGRGPSAEGAGSVREMGQRQGALAPPAAGVRTGRCTTVRRRCPVSGDRRCRLGTGGHTQLDPVPRISRVKVCPSPTGGWIGGTPTSPTAGEERGRRLRRGQLSGPSHRAPRPQHSTANSSRDPLPSPSRPGATCTHEDALGPSRGRASRGPRSARSSVRDGPPGTPTTRPS